MNAAREHCCLPVHNHVQQNTDQRYDDEHTTQKSSWSDFMTVSLSTLGKVKIWYVINTLIVVSVLILLIVKISKD